MLDLKLPHQVQSVPVPELDADDGDIGMLGAKDLGCAGSSRRGAYRLDATTLEQNLQTIAQGVVNVYQDHLHISVGLPHRLATETETISPIGGMRPPPGPSMPRLSKQRADPCATTPTAGSRIS
jgi:hypothetical protein